MLARRTLRNEGLNGHSGCFHATELYERAKEYYDENKETLKLKDGIRSLTGFINLAIREFLNEEHDVEQAEGLIDRSMLSVNKGVI